MKTRAQLDAAKAARKAGRAGRMAAAAAEMPSVLWSIYTVDGVYREARMAAARLGREALRLKAKAAGWK